MSVWRNMRISCIGPLRTAFLVACSVVASVAAAQVDVDRNFLLTDKEAIAVLPPEFVCGPSVLSASWSSDGRYLLVVRRAVDITPASVKRLFSLDATKGAANPPSEDQILIWSATTKKVKTVTSFPSATGSVYVVQWIPGTSSVACTIETENPNDPDDFTLSTYVLGADGTMTALGRSRGMENRIDWEVSPSKPFAVLINSQTSKSPGGITTSSSTLQFVGAKGAFGNPVKIDSLFGNYFWGSDGQFYGMLYAPRRSQSEPKVPPTSMRVDPTSGLVPATMPAPYEPIETGRLKTLEVTTSVMLPQVKAKPLILALAQSGGDESKSLSLTTDGGKAMLSPKEDAVAYESQGMLLVRSLVSVPKLAYLKAKESADRQAALIDAKQSALALVMISLDCDGEFPSNVTGWQDKVMPYLKDANVLGRFVYTFTGGVLGKDKNPAETILGFIPGPGGRAVAYADGHVIWEPDSVKSKSKT